MGMCAEYPDAIRSVAQDSCGEPTAEDSTSLFISFRPETTSETLRSLILAEEYAMTVVWRFCQIRKVRCLLSALQKEEQALGNVQEAVLNQRHQLALMDYVETVTSFAPLPIRAARKVMRNGRVQV